MHEYAKSLIKKFDLNGDGLISFRELCDGLKKMGIVLSLRETQAFMDKLDFNKDGEITLEELSRVLQSSEAGSLSKYVSSLTADQVLSKLKTNGQNFNSMREYAKFLIRKFDDNNDGIISFRELSEGLKSLGMSLSIPEMKSLMKRLDFNKDGNITEEELVKVFSGQVADNQIPAGQFMQVINSALTKIASNADDLSNMKEYARYIVTRFDKDGDGLISFKELTDGCKTMNIFLTPLEKEGLMRKLDVN
jgi:Ca2+-binding EF-hand superfamily protein